MLARVPARREKRTPRVAVVTTTAGGAAMVVDPLASRGVDVAPPSEATYARFDAAGIKVSRSRLIDLTLAGARYEVMKAGARHSDHGARVRPGGGRGRLLGAVLSGARRAADHRQHAAARQQADRRVPGSRSPAGAGRTRQGRGREFLHARSLRRRRRGRAGAAAAAAAPGHCGWRAARLRRRQPADRSTSSKPMACSIGLAFRTPRRWRSASTRRRRRCPSGIRGR